MASDGESGGAPAETAGAITRRQALKRGAVLGGALVWATPVVQVVGMRPALAQTVSPGCRIEIRVLFGTTEIVLCLEGPPELCECIANCSAGDADCIGQCIIDIPPHSFVVGPCE